MAVTIYDIAKAVGTSHATVSRALSGRGEIGKATVEKVRRAARELGYRPDRAARMLKAGKTHSIGIILPDLSNPYCVELLQAVQDLCHARDYQIFPMDYRNDEGLARKCLEQMLERHCDGCIAGLMRFAPLRPIIEEFWASKIPLVAAGLPEDINETQVDGYRGDYSKGILEAVDHLAKLGHREIVFAGSWADEVGVASDRFAFLQAAFRDHGLKWSPKRIVRTWSGSQLEDGYTSARTIFGSQPQTTAILGINDLFCAGLMRGLSEMGLRVPADVSIVGTDDTWVAQYWPVPLTSISQCTKLQAAFAVETVFERLEAPEWGPPKRMTLVSELKMRASTAAPRTTQ